MRADGAIPCPWQRGAQRALQIHQLEPTLRARVGRAGRPWRAGPERRGRRGGGSGERGLGKALTLVGAPWRQESPARAPADGAARAARPAPPAPPAPPGPPAAPRELRED